MTAQPDRPPVFPRGPASPITPPDLVGAICRETDPLLWFPDLAGTTEREQRAAEAVAVSLCAECPARPPCRRWALDVAGYLPLGVIGGTTETDRRRRRRKDDAVIDATRLEASAKVGASNP